MTVIDSIRTRTFEWADPQQLLATGARYDGLTMLRRIAAGTLPPPPAIAALGGVELLEVESGRVVFTLDPAEHHYNPLGTVHGGVLATMADTAAGCAVHSALPLGASYATIDLATRFVRPVTVGTGTVRVEGSLVQLGGRTALAEARITDRSGRLLVHATATCMLLRPSLEEAS